MTEEDRYDEPAFMLVAALDLLREVDTRDALIFIARFYYGLPLRTIGVLFGISAMSVLRSIKKTRKYFRPRATAPGATNEKQ